MLTLDVPVRTTRPREVASGITPLQSQSDSALDPSEAPGGQQGWTWSLDANPAEILNLWTVQVRVSRARPDGTTGQASPLIDGLIGSLST